MPPVAEPPAAEALPEEPPAIEPPVERHDPFAAIRDLPWMNRRLSPSGRIMTLVRRDLEAFAVLEGREPNGADIDAVVQKHVDYMTPILRREQATDAVYDELDRRRAERR